MDASKLSCLHIKSSTAVERMEGWGFPSPNFLKLNLDELVVGTCFNVSCNCVRRHNARNFLGGFSRNLGIPSIMKNFGKNHAWGIHWVWELGKSWLKVKNISGGFDDIVVENHEYSHEENHAYTPLIFIIRQLLNNWKEVLKHSYRKLVTDLDTVLIKILLSILVFISKDILIFKQIKPNYHSCKRGKSHRFYG